MPRIEGFIKSVNGKRFVAAFAIPNEANDVNAPWYWFEGTFSEAFSEGFLCEDSWITYTNLDDLEGTKTFEGKITGNTLEFTVGEGITVTGELEKPLASITENPDLVVVISGEATWKIA